MHLPADSPGEWLARHVCTDLTTAARDAAVPTSRLVEGGWLRERFSRIDPGDPRRLHHITGLATWFPGTIARELGHAFVGAAAGFLPEPQQLRWALHDEGWADGIVFAPGTRAVVLAGHEWDGRPDVVVASSRDELRRRTIDAIVALAEPLVDHLVAVTGFGRQGLWHEVSDALPGVLTWDARFPVTSADVDDFRWMLTRAGVPWKRPPVLELVEEDWGTACIQHRGGCCMAYTASGPAAPGQDELDEDLRRYYAELPESADRRYCINCKFRSYDDARVRQLWWRRHEARNDAVTG